MIEEIVSHLRSFHKMLGNGKFHLSLSNLAIYTEWLTLQELRKMSSEPSKFLPSSYNYKEKKKPF